MNKILKNIPLFLILTVAAVLRFYHLNQIPYTFDELSTLFRLNFSSFSNLVELGIKPDTHPAGLPVFLYYYTKIFGTSVAAIKSVFIIFGIISVYIVYKLGKGWFNKTAGLFAASLMAVLQYPITQSQIARMYGFGILFVLLTVWFLYRYIKKDKPSIGCLTGFVLSASVSAYTHYFSLLFVGIVGITGLFLLNGKKLKYYILSGIAIFILFTPHLGIFITHLHKGGISWLGPLKWHTLWTYFKYFFNHSPLIATVIISTIALFFKFRLKDSKYRIISLLWFITPILIGSIYAYISVNVMHEKVLYFSFPFILLFLASFIKDVKNEYKLAMVVIVLTIGAFSLIKECKYYQLFYKNRLQLVAEDSYKWLNADIIDDVDIVKITSEKYERFYYMKNHLDIVNKTTYIDSINDIKSFIHLIKNLKHNYLFFGVASNYNPTYLAIAKYYYPNTIKYDNTVAGESWLLKKTLEPDVKWDCEYWSYTDTFDNVEDIYNCDTSILDSANNIWGYSDYDFIATKEYNLSDISFSTNNLIELSLDFEQLGTLGGASLVVSIEKGKNKYVWLESNFDNFILNNKKGKVFLSVRLADYFYPSKAKLKMYIWNKQKDRYLLDNLNIIVRAGNPYIYGHIGKIPFNTKKYCLQ
jgi:uncharacterized membrane protein